MELLPDNTLYLNFDGTKYIDEVEVIKIKELALDLVDYKPFKNIVNFGGKSGILSNEAKKFISSDSDFKRLKICDALITSSFTTTVLIGFYIKLFNPVTPTKSFSTFDEALSWVESFPS